MGIEVGLPVGGKKLDYFEMRLVAITTNLIGMAGFIVALIVAIFITGIAAVLIKRTGPWGSAWTFFLFAFLALWTSTVYVRGIGPVYYGIAWLPLLFISVILFVLLVVPGANKFRDDAMARSAGSGGVSEQRANRIARANHFSTAAGKFFWIMITLLLVAIILGIINPQWAR
jgi:hypothetical protein